MNDTDSLLDADLNDETDGSEVTQAPVNDALRTALTNHVANRTDNGDDTSTVKWTPTPVDPVQAAAAVDPATVTVKKGAGRKVDTTGKTALGKARLLYAANDQMTTKELKTLFFKELNPIFGTDAGTVQTYVSLVRKPPTKKSKVA